MAQRVPSAVVLDELRVYRTDVEPGIVEVLGDLLIVPPGVFHHRPRLTVQALPSGTSSGDADSWNLLHQSERYYGKMIYVVIWRKMPIRMRIPLSVAAPRKPLPSTFYVRRGLRRKAGTGCVTQINEKLWEGRYSPIWPDGKKHARNVYAHSEEDCEKLLAELIIGMKAEIGAEKERLKTAAKAG